MVRTGKLEDGTQVDVYGVTKCCVNCLNYCVGSEFDDYWQHCARLYVLESSEPQHMTVAETDCCELWEPDNV